MAMRNSIENHKVSVGITGDILDITMLKGCQEVPSSLQEENPGERHTL